MSHPLLLALFADRAKAAEAARAVRELGIERSALSIVARSHDDEGVLAQAVDGTPGVEIEDSKLGWVLGELSGHILAAIAVVLPGIGPIVAGGPLAAELGEVVGHATGGLVATLERAGLTDTQATAWESRIESGAVLLGVHAQADTSAGVRLSLERHGADEVALVTWDG
jgi:hypothetical protein